MEEEGEGDERLAGEAGGEQSLRPHVRVGVQVTLKHFGGERRGLGVEEVLAVGEFEEGG